MADTLTSLRSALRKRYEVERILGRGGMAIVLLARERKYDRRVAIKVLSPDVTTAVAAERFLREIRITAQLQHPHIVPLLDSGEAAGLLYAVMPYVEGETLREHLINVGRLSVAEALLVAREVADALDYAHRRGVIHRDIKPENILLSDGHAVVSDFGIARAVGLAGHTLTGAGLPLGTAAYMSPEQAMGHVEMDGRTDVYALGCVVYEMLTGRMAFGGSNLKEVLARHLDGRIEPIEALRSDVPPAVVDWIDRATARHREERFETAAEAAASLRLLLGEQARTPTPPESEGPARLSAAHAAPPERRPAASGRWLVGAAAAVVLALGVTIVWPQRETPVRREVSAAAPLVPAAAPVASLAVLPFDVRGGRAEDVYLGEGIGDEITGRLVQVPGLKVISRTSVMALAESRLTIPEIADTLHVRYVLEGTIQRAGDRILTRVRLVDATTDAAIWQRTYQHGEHAMIALQDSIAAEVGDRLVPAGAMPVRSAGATTAVPSAYDAYLKGTYWLERRTPEGFRAAAEAFAEAIRMDSSYAAAYAGLAEAHAITVIYGFRTDADPYAQVAEALRLADHAVRLDPDLAAGYHARADARALALAPDSVILADLRRATALSPNSAHLQMAVAHEVAKLGRHDSAIRLATGALALDPLSPGLRHSLAIVALSARRYDLALREARRTLVLAPADPVAPVIEAYALLLAGRPEQCAEREFEGWAAVRAMCLAAVGRTAEADRLADTLGAALARGEYSVIHQYGNLAAYRAWRGDGAGALRWLDRAIERSPLMLHWQLDAGLFDRVREQPAFREGLVALERRVRARVAER